MRVTFQPVTLASAIGAIFLWQTAWVQAAHEHPSAQRPPPKHAEQPAGHSHAKAACHCGVVIMTKEFHFENVFTPEGLRVYLYDLGQNPLHWKQAGVGKVEGTVTVAFHNSSRKPITAKLEEFSPVMKAGAKGQEKVLWSCPMHSDQYGTSAGKCKLCGMAYVPQDYLSAKMDLKGLKPGEAMATITLRGIPGQKEKGAITYSAKNEVIAGHKEYAKGKQEPVAHRWGQHKAK